MYGFYKGQEVSIHYSSRHSTAEPMGWYFSMRAFSPSDVARILSNTAEIYGHPATDTWLGTYHGKDHPSQRHFDSFYRSFTTIKKQWRKYCSSRKRTMKRAELIKEELIATVWSPERISKLLDAGVDIESL
jgi:hypothetical protein